MANPVSTVPSAQPVYVDTVCTEPDGTPTPIFHRFLTGLWLRTGGEQGTNSTAIHQTANTALTVSNSAATGANVAQNSADTAQTTADNAYSLAQTALATAQSAQNTATGALASAAMRTNNLADLTNIATARSNLDLGYLPISFGFDTCPAGLNRAVPVTQKLQLAANLAGTQVWWWVAPMNDAVFYVGRAHAGSSAIMHIGTITLVHGGTGVSLSVQGTVILTTGDTLVVTCPNPADPTLAQVGITIPLLVL